MVSGRRERAQVILIGAIALAFIILGIVVVFNGVLYTEALSSGTTSHSASNAAAVEYELEQSVGCLLERVESESDPGDVETHATTNVTGFGDAYRNATLGSTAAAVTIRGIDVTDPPGEPLRANLTVTYDSAALSYERNQTIEAGCP